MLRYVHHLQAHRYITIKVYILKSGVHSLYLSFYFSLLYLKWELLVPRSCYRSDHPPIQFINLVFCVLHQQGGVYTGNRAALFAQQPQKSQQAQSPQLSQVRGGLTSPGPRQSPFPADISPTSGASYATASHGQYTRLQRTMSVPNSNMASSQVPPGNFSFFL